LRVGNRKKKWKQGSREILKEGRKNQKGRQRWRNSGRKFLPFISKPSVAAGAARGISASLKPASSGKNQKIKARGKREKGTSKDQKGNNDVETVEENSYRSWQN
jgi:hypothetical protein